jgi:4-hydroxy-3-polyprenylbenzoate decarboxylase
MYKNLRQALLDLEKAGMLKRVHEEVDPYLQMAEIARQAFDSKGPALLFEKVKGCRFQAACNIFGTRERMEFLFRDTLAGTRTAVQFKSNPVEFFKQAGIATLCRAAAVGINSLPRRSGSIRDFEECTLADLPQIVGWPEDGGAFVTLPQVASRPGERAGILQTNLGMYRVQISGNDYAADECGLHYQIKRDIARHHQKAIEEGRPLKVSVFIGGPPAHTVAAVMPMPENLSELTFAGMLGGRRFRYFEHDGYLVSSDAEFCILGEMAPDLKPEGPFGDHVGYYSGKHPFPYMHVKKVLCKKNAIYPFTSVGRPPKEDTIFGDFIHEITRPMVPVSIPGVHAVHAVDAAGVHPLCLAVASERFVPYARPEDREPMELLKTANALLGFNQVSLSKYLMLAAKEDASGSLDARDVPAFFAHVLERIDFARDLHFQTSTTIDTLDYTGTSLNHGSKLVMAAAGPKRRELRNEPADLASLALPAGFANPKIAMKGVLMVQWNAGGNAPATADIAPLLNAIKNWEFRESYPWVSVVDDTSTIGDFDAHKSLDDFLWLTFTRSDPAQDAYGIDAHFVDKHWAIQAPLVIDARIKPRHQKVLEVSDNVIQKAREVLENA